MGTDLPQSGAGRQTSGRREPTRDLPRPLVEEKQSDATPVFTRFPALVDGSFEVPGWLGILGASHATGDGQEMACQGLSAVLALEIPPTFRAATDPKGLAGSDPENEQGESLMGCRANPGYTVAPWL